MKKIFALVSLFLLIGVSSASALLNTDNTDKETFKYEVPYVFASEDLTASLTDETVAVIGGGVFASNFSYVIPRDGRLVGISVAGSRVCTTGAASFDVTINGTVTGFISVIESAARSAVGTSGSSGTQFAYTRQDRAETPVAQGFKTLRLTGNLEYHDANHIYGKASAIAAGDRIGVEVTTSSDFLAPTFADYIITIYVLE